MAVEETDSLKRTAYVRLATTADIPVIKLLIEGLAKFENLLHECKATEDALKISIFRRPPFTGPTVLLLELSEPPSDPQSSPLSAQTQPGGDAESFPEESREVTISAKVDDVKFASYISTRDASRTVIGFVLFFPNYSTFLAKPGLYIEDLYVREAYRRQGLGTILLSTVAQQAAKGGFGRVEWSVLDWNVNAIKFYENMGAIVQQEWRICRLTGDALQAYDK